MKALKSSVLFLFYFSVGYFVLETISIILSFIVGYTLPVGFSVLAGMLVVTYTLYVDGFFDLSEMFTSTDDETESELEIDDIIEMFDE